MDTQKRINSIMDTEIRAIIYTQKHRRSITDTGIRTIMDASKNTHRRTQKYANKKVHTYLYKSTHKKSTQEETQHAHTRNS